MSRTQRMKLFIRCVTSRLGNMTLATDTLTSLQAASNAGVKDAMSRIATNFDNNNWFAAQHRYRASPNRSRYAEIRSDINRRRLSDNALAEYTSISAPTHALDGWSFLGRSVNALLKGDPYSAMHLAYYAELRATIAILAAEGIGIFDRINCIVDDNGDCFTINVKESGTNRKLPTHQSTWAVFEWWANEDRSIDLLRRVIKPDRRDLGTWLDATTKSHYALQAVGAKWLKSWGLDIKQFSGDRTSRNDVSYWPNTINSWSTRSVFEQCVTITDIWAILEPAPESRFATLDRHLLHNVLFQGYRGATGQRPTSANFKNGFGREINSILRKLGITGEDSSNWHNFFTNGHLRKPLVIKLAGSRSKMGADTHVLEVISRATMLLRLATGASANLLLDVGIDREKAAFWVDSIGSERGLWSGSTPPDELYELWSDVQDELENWDEMRHLAPLDAHAMWKQHSDSLTILSEYEKVALWGLGL